MQIKAMSKTLNWIALGAIVTFSFALTLNASLQESAIMDELAHIPAGYGYIKYFDFRLNPEHPPIVKALAALPLLFQNFNFPTDSPHWQEDINGQWTVGAQFLYEYGNDADKIINWARMGPIFLTILLIIFVYIWASELIGRWWTLMPTFLIAFSPTILAHGHYVTTDIGAALGIFIATYYFVKLLLKPIRRNYILAGIAFGIAQLMKFSAVLLIPLFIFLAVIFCLYKIYSNWNEAIVEKYKKALNFIIKHFLILLFIFIIGYLLVYAIYFIFTINYPIGKQHADTELTLGSFAGGADPNWETCSLDISTFRNIKISRRVRCLAEINIWFSQNKIFRPLGEYMLGVLMVMQRSSGGNTGYFLGEVSASGWWYYFPVIFALKEPLPSLILLLLALILGLWNIIKNIRFRSVLKNIENYLGTHFSEFSMLVFVIFYWLYSIKSPLNIGVRHIMPTMPFIYILTASAIKKWFNLGNADNGQLIKKIIAAISMLAKNVIKGALIFVLLGWYFIETLFAAPYYLSYFNELGGGVSNGYEYVTDSNYDWGQDMRRLARWVNKQNNDNDNDIEKIAVDYFGGASPKYYLGDKFEPWWSSKGNPQNQEIEWLAVSINTLQGALGKLRPGQLRKPEDEYQWLQKIRNPYQPDYKAGTSIFIYKLQ